ncbi:protein-disulfide reductase DsbD family protein [Aquirufa lenticrescens]|uniref:protein-disulfide reductase DsbD family protein n=1 Tax=Aquirufa lenticrescens TaxID=2696560 RepID=UPI001CAA48A5|nr:cytochrome c biogenesis protein CcdA [Aquirufa lenticrescens]UAJ13255.1 disulfide bond formation protein DsbD [Aquirufa lenticrescens]
MKLKFIAFLLFAFLAIPALAQKITPAKWSWSIKPANPKVGEQAEVIFKVAIEKDWYLYSSDFDKDLGPTVTTVTFKPGAGYQTVGELKAINPHAKNDTEIWNGTYTYFTGQAEFRQKIKITASDYTIEGSYDSQSCSNVSGLCVPIKGPFSLKGKAEKVVSADTAAAPVIEPETVDSVVTKPAVVATPTEAPEDDSLFAFFWIALGAGFLALLTPCVYPLIPMTVSFFTKQKGGKGLAFLYGGFIVLIYVFFGTLLAFFAGASFANFLSTHWIPNMIFFTIFILFGISFLGAFEIVLPSNLVNTVDAKSDKGGFIGVFFMAFTLVLVSFSCTGPLAGSILIAASQGAFLKPIIGMLGFSLAFAIPFTLFAIFPGFMQKLPKSGNWMNEVKVVLGFLEIALAFKFLSVADQVYHWHLLDREIFLAIWIAIFTALTLYLFGKISLPHDGPSKNLSVPRTLFATAVLAFVIYLVPGMFGAPLKGLSGWLPPMNSQDFKGSQAAEPTAQKSDVLYSDFLELPLGLDGYFDFEQAKAAALKANKPLFIDFTGHGCVNCRKMEEYVWSDPSVLQRLKNDYVVVALYCDDKTELPADKWYTSKVDGQEKKTLGDQNLDFQISRFNSNAQPHYVLLDPRKDDKPMVQPVAFDANVFHFVSFLDEGKSIYQSAK